MVPLAHRGRSPLVTSYSVEEHGSVEPRTGKTRTGMSEGVVTVFPVRPVTETRSGTAKPSRFCRALRGLYLEKEDVQFGSLPTPMCQHSLCDKTWKGPNV